MTELMAAPPPGNEPWIAAVGLGFSHGVAPVLRGIAFDMYPGRHYVVAGPNGAGKSTLLDILARLRRPDEGTIHVMGRAASAYSIGEYARIASLAPQEFRLDFPFTVREVAAMGRRPYLDRWGRLGVEDERAVDRALAAVRLDGIAAKAVTALSGGERRRCVVARALAQATPVVFLDEPDSGLDVEQAIAVMSLAADLARDGALVVTVSHDLNLAARYGHEFVFLKDGRLAAAGPVEAVFTDEILSRVYDAEARVERSGFTGGLAVQFRAAGGGPGCGAAGHDLPASRFSRRPAE